MSSSAGAASSTARGSGRRSSSSSSTTSSSSLPTYSSSGNNGYTSLRNGSDAIVNLNDNRKKGENFNLPEDASMPLTNRCETPSSTTSTAVPATKASWLRIYSLCIANFGINCAWALEFAMTTPYFEKGLKAGKVISHAVWLVGPLSGFIVAPIVGSLSDRCRSRFGRRRPFIFAGMIATLVGMALFSNALGVAQFLVGSVFRSGEERIVQIVSITVAILAFCVLDLAINTTMWPVRALQGDLIPVDQQHSVQSASIVMFSLGDLTASALLRLFPEPVSQIQICFLVAALIYSTSVASLLLLGHETPLTPLTDEEHHDEEADASGEGDTSETAQRRGASAYNIFAYLHALPSWMWRIGITHALGFFALFCFLPNTSSWLGGSVLGGDPDAASGSKKAQLYEKGVSLYGTASLPRTLIQIVYSAIYPYLLYHISPGQLMSISFGIFGIVLFVFSSTNVPQIGQLVVVLMALPIAAHFTLPVGLTVENSASSNRGRYLGALNCFAVIPQLIDTGYTGFVSREFGESTVMRIGAVWSILTALFALFYMRIN